jgi:hypothetical protein
MLSSTVFSYTHFANVLQILRPQNCAYKIVSERIVKSRMSDVKNYVECEIANDKTTNRVIFITQQIIASYSIK